MGAGKSGNWVFWGRCWHSPQGHSGNGQRILSEPLPWRGCALCRSLCGSGHSQADAPFQGCEDRQFLVVEPEGDLSSPLSQVLCQLRQKPQIQEEKERIMQLLDHHFKNIINYEILHFRSEFLERAPL